MAGPILAILIGLALLVWSADKFVLGASGTARYFGMPSLLIGMLIVGFGTSAPEMVVSAVAALQGSPELALGNAYGSNIANIALILGITAVLSPIAVNSKVIRSELPVLAVVTGIAAWQLHDQMVSRLDAICLLLIFLGVVLWSIRKGLKTSSDQLGDEMEADLATHPIPIRAAIFWLAAGLALLVISSRILVWGAVSVAQAFGLSDLIIGLTIVAVGTSLPELASAIAATRKGEHDIAVGAVIGSNLLNTLVVVGIAGAIHPMLVGPEVLARDVSTMGGLTLLLFVMAYGFFGRPGRINRWEGAGLLLAFVIYSTYLIRTAIL